MTVKNTIKKIKNLRKEVENMLRDAPETRNSDLLLTLKLWVKLYPSRIFYSDGNYQSIKLRDILDMPREDNIKRLRAKIQNEENKYLPTDESVRKQRGITEEAWYNYTLYN